MGGKGNTSHSRLVVVVRSVEDHSTSRAHRINRGDSRGSQVSVGLGLGFVCAATDPPAFPPRWEASHKKDRDTGCHTVYDCYASIVCMCWLRERKEPIIDQIAASRPSR